MNISNLDMASEAKEKELTTIVYALYGLGLFFALPTLIAIIINYVKRDQLAGNLAKSHFRWQIRTFWFGLLWWLIGAITAGLVVGIVICLVVYFWWIYRFVKGYLALRDGKVMY